MSMELISGTSEIYTREDGSLVTSWCNRFDTRVFTDFEKRERMGVVDFPANVVCAADAGVPTDYEAAKAAGFNVGARYSFASARSFLKEAAQSTYGIRGYD